MPYLQSPLKVIQSVCNGVDVRLCHRAYRASRASGASDPGHQRRTKRA